MKRKLLFSLVFSFFISFHTFSQKTNIVYTNKRSVISFGHGIGNIWKTFLNNAVSNIPSINYKISSIGPVTLIYEYDIFKKSRSLFLQRISSGIAVSWSQVKGQYSWSGDKIIDKLTIFTAMARANYHLGRFRKFDPYFGGGMGYVHSRYSNDQSASRNSVPGLLGFSAQVGAHYYIMPYFGVLTEAGYVNGSFAQIGISVKI